MLQTTHSERQYAAATAERARDDKMAAQAAPTLDPAKLQSLLVYNPETGKLTWLRRSPEDYPKSHQWNAKYAGEPAFTAYQGTGYLRGAILGRYYLAHRVAWAIQTGAWPANEIDHINGVRDDNRWVNLRAASRIQNAQNTAGNKGTSSKYRGVCWNSNRSKWQANICAFGAKQHLGMFKCEQRAAEAYDRAAIQCFGAFAKLNFPAPQE